MGSLAADKRAYNWAEFSRLFEGLGVRAFYMVKRVTHQVGENEDLMPVLPLQFTLFLYKAPNEIILLWRAGIPMLDQLDEDGDFEEYQQSLMPTLFPPPMVSFNTLFFNLRSFTLDSSTHALYSTASFCRLLLMFLLRMELFKLTLWVLRISFVLPGLFLFTRLMAVSTRRRSLGIPMSWGTLSLRMLAL